VKYIFLFCFCCLASTSSDSFAQGGAGLTATFNGGAARVSKAITPAEQTIHHLMGISGYDLFFRDIAWKSWVWLEEETNLVKVKKKTKDPTFRNRLNFYYFSSQSYESIVKEIAGKVKKEELLDLDAMLSDPSVLKSFWFNTDSKNFPARNVTRFINAKMPINLKRIELCSNINSDLNFQRFKQEFLTAVPGAVINSPPAVVTNSDKNRTLNYCYFLFQNLNDIELAKVRDLFKSAAFQSVVNSFFVKFQTVFKQKAPGILIFSNLK